MNPLSLDDLPVAAMIVGLHGRVEGCNRAAELLAGRSLVEVPLRALVAADDAERVLEATAQALDRAEEPEVGPIVVPGVLIERPDQPPAPVSLSVRAVGELDGRPIRLLCVISPEDPALHPQQARTSDRVDVVATDVVPAGIVSSRAGIRADYANQQCCALYGADLEELVGFGWLERLHPADIARAVEVVEQVVATGQPARLRSRLVRGREVVGVEVRLAAVRNEGDVGYVASIDDITSTQREAARLAADARRDPVTSLPNRLAVVERLRRRPRRGRRFVLCIDVGGLRDVSERHGNARADGVLDVVAKRLVGVVEESDLAGRLGGDQLVVVMDGVTSEGRPRALAERVRAVVEGPIALDGLRFTVTASIGIVPVEPDDEPEQVLSAADAAVFAAKRAVADRIVIAPPPPSVVQRRRQIGELLERCLDTSGQPGLHLDFHPIARTDGTPVALHATPRFTTERVGLLSPAELVDAAQHAGLTGRLQAAVLGRALTPLEHWQRMAPDISVMVDVDATHIDPSFLALLATSTSPQALWLNVAALSVTELSSIALDGARAMRVRIALSGVAPDDLSMLPVPPDLVRLSPLLIGELDHTADTPLLDELVLDRPQVPTLAPGVTTPHHLAVLRRVGVALIEGPYLAAPMQARHATSWLRDRTASAITAAS